MSIDDSRELKPLVERAVELIERRAKAERAKTADDTKLLIMLRTLCWGGAIIAFVIAFGLSILRWTGEFIPAQGVILWFAAGMGASLVGALALHVTVADRRARAESRRTNERMDLAASKLREEIRDARPVDAEVLGQMVAEIQVNRQLIRNIDQKTDDNERQRQSDVAQIREASVKRLEEIHDQVEQLRGALPLMLEEAARKGYAAGIAHALDAVSEKVSAHMEPLLTEVLALKEVQKDLERDLAAVILRQQQGPASGGANVIDIWQARPEGIS